MDIGFIFGGAVVINDRKEAGPVPWVKGPEPAEGRNRRRKKEGNKEEAQKSV